MDSKPRLHCPGELFSFVLELHVMVASGNLLFLAPRRFDIQIFYNFVGI